MPAAMRQIAGEKRFTVRAALGDVMLEAEYRRETRTCGLAYGEG